MTVLLRPDQLDWALQNLKAGNPVGLPTETVYGLAGIAWHEPSLARIFKIKNRPHFDPLIVHVLDLAMTESLVKEVSPMQKKLMESFWPGPLSILFEKNECVPELCTAASPWVALRSPAHPVFREVLKQVKMPLAAPSANRFGRISPTRAEQVIEELGPFGLEAVVDGGACERGIESTIVRVKTAEHLEVLRPGALSLEKLATCLGTQVHIEVIRAVRSDHADAPGQLESHYAPKTPVKFIENLSNLEIWKSQDLSDIALLQVFEDPKWSTLSWGRSEVLSKNGSDTEAAAKLFSALRSLDKLGMKQIVAVKADDRGLGIAINDRLRRAAAKG